MSKWTPRLTIGAVERTPFGLWVHLECITALYVLIVRDLLFSMKRTWDWLMMVEGLPLGLLMQRYHTLSIFLSGGGEAVVSLSVLLSAPPLLLFFISVSFLFFIQRRLALLWLWPICGQLEWFVESKRSPLLKYLSLAPSLALILSQFLAISLGPSFDGLFSTCSRFFLPVILFSVSVSLSLSLPFCRSRPPVLSAAPVDPKPSSPPPVSGNDRHLFNPGSGKWD